MSTDILWSEEKISTFFFPSYSFLLLVLFSFYIYYFLPLSISPSILLPSPPFFPFYHSPLRPLSLIFSLFCSLLRSFLFLFPPFFPSSLLSFLPNFLPPPNSSLSQLFHSFLTSSATILPPSFISFSFHLLFCFLSFCMSIPSFYPSSKHPSFLLPFLRTIFLFFLRQSLSLYFFSYLHRYFMGLHAFFLNLH